MPHTVALLAPNGHVGSTTLPYLLKAHAQGKINIVLLHRPGGPPKNLPSDVNIDVREIQLDGPIETMKEALSGVNVLISAVFGMGVVLQHRIVEALAEVPGFKTFIPARYSIPLHESDYEYLPFMIPFQELEKKSKELGVSVTTVWAGMFDYATFSSALGDTDLIKNTVEAGEGQLTGKLPITSVDHLARALADLVQRDPGSLVNKAFSVVTYWVSGNDIVEAFSKANRKPATIIDHPPERQAEWMADIGDITNLAFRGVYYQHWEKEDLIYPNPIEDPDKIPFERLTQKYFAKLASEDTKS